jgi:hypothetical protein
VGGARLHTEFLLYQVEQGLPRSGIYEIENSTWLPRASERRLRSYPLWRDWDENKYHHYVIQGRDNYYEIIAAGYSEKRISYAAGDLKRLVDEG